MIHCIRGPRMDRGYVSLARRARPWRIHSWVLSIARVVACGASPRPTPAA